MCHGRDSAAVWVDDENLSWFSKSNQNIRDFFRKVLSKAQTSREKRRNIFTLWINLKQQYFVEEMKRRICRYRQHCSVNFLHQSPQRVNYTKLSVEDINKETLREQVNKQTQFTLVLSRGNEKVQFHDVYDNILRRKKVLKSIKAVASGRTLEKLFMLPQNPQSEAFILSYS